MNELQVQWHKMIESGNLPRAESGLGFLYGVCDDDRLLSKYVCVGLRIGTGGESWEEKAEYRIWIVVKDREEWVNHDVSVNGANFGKVIWVEGMVHGLFTSDVGSGKVDFILADVPSDWMNERMHEMDLETLDGNMRIGLSKTAEGSNLRIKQIVGSLETYGGRNAKKTGVPYLSDMQKHVGNKMVTHEECKEAWKRWNESS